MLDGDKKNINDNYIKFLYYSMIDN